MTTTIKAQKMHIEDPPVARALFGDVRWAWVWLILRVYVGWQWAGAGWGKVTNSAWVGSQAGTAISGFVKGALTQTTGAVSINPILFAIATWLVLAWKTAGWWGLDRWVLPVLGTPWSPGAVFHKDAESK